MYEFSIIIDKQHLIDLNKFHIMTKLMPFNVIAVTLLALLAAFFYFTGDTTTALIMGGLAVFMILMCGLIIISAKQSYKKPGSPVGTKMYVRISGDSFFDRSESPDMTSTTEAKWNFITASFETKNYFYLYINQLNAFILPKRDMTAGDPAELSRLLAEKLGPKYKITRSRI